jgi:hypothetical protein
MTQRLAQHEWSWLSEEQAPKRLRIDLPNPQNLAGRHAALITSEPIHTFYDSASNKLHQPLESFNGDWLGLLEETLPDELSSIFDSYSNIGIECDGPLSVSFDELRPQAVGPAQSGISDYGRFARNSVDEGSRISREARTINESFLMEDQICLGMV